MNFMNWRNWPYWVKGTLCGVVLFSSLYIAEKAELFTYSSRKQHPYVASVHRVIATAPIISALMLNPIFCRPIEMEGGGTTSCFESFDVIYTVLILLEIVFVSAFVGYLYGKLKTRNTPSVNGNSL